MGHHVGLEENYYRPTEEQLENEYRSSIDNLTINEENRLQKKVQKLEGKVSKIDHLYSRLELHDYHRLEDKLSSAKDENTRKLIEEGMQEHLNEYYKLNGCYPTEGELNLFKPKKFA